MTTTLYLCKVPYDRKYNHVINWRNVDNRADYFLSLPKVSYTFDDKLLNPKGNTVEIALDYAYLIAQGYNYIVVKEERDMGGYTRDYTWYAFIIDLERTNVNTTIINYELDYWNTYFFDENEMSAVMDIRDAFIQREHQNRWTKGSRLRLIPQFSRTLENIETGDMILDKQEVSKTFLYNKVGSNYTAIATVIPYLVVYTGDLSSQIVARRGSVINGLASKDLHYFLLFNITDLDTNLKPNIMFQEQPYEVDDGNLVGYHINKIFYGDITPGSESVIPNFDSSLDNIIKITKLNSLPFRLIKTGEDYNNTFIAVENAGDTWTNPLFFKALRYGDGDGGSHAIHINNLDIRTLVKNNAIPPAFTIGGVYASRVPSITDNASINYEPKVRNEQFEIVKVSSIKSDNLNITLDKINYVSLYDNSANVYIRSSFDLWGYEEISITGYNKNDMFDVVRSKQNNEINLTNDAYLNYMKNNRNQIETQQVLNGVQIVSGVGQIVGGGALLATGSVGALGGLGMGISGFNRLESGIGGIASEMSKQRDYKNKVDEVKASSNTITLDAINSIDHYHCSYYKVRDVFKQRAYQLFMKQGYVANEYRVPDLESRYYFNYVKLGYVELNPELIGEDSVRQLIENIYMRGVTLWHYRDKNTFKFLEYDKENWEVSLL